jgi:predicted transposase/invertase (TIGR01784 family)
MSSSPHDALFKVVLGQPEHAGGVLRAVLPARAVDALDWPTLALSPGSFVDPALSGRHTDLLFSIRWRGGGDDALVYLVFEHQSTADRRMAFRLLRYQVRIWERWLADHPHAEQLPVVVPIVLYHGAEPWSAPRAFEALFAIPDAARTALAPHLVQFTYLLDDLSVIPDAELRERSMTALGRLVEICLKHARTRADLLDILFSWADIVREVIAAPNGLEAMSLVLRYIALVNDHVDPQKLQAFLDRVAPPDAKDALMTYGERLIQEGFQRGEQEGVQRGERALLLRQLRSRFGGQVDAAIEQRVAAAPAEKIPLWGERVLTATSLSELLAD